MEKQINIGRVDTELATRFEIVKVELFRKYRTSVKSIKAFEYAVACAERELGIYDPANKINFGKAEWTAINQTEPVEADEDNDEQKEYEGGATDSEGNLI